MQKITPFLWFNDNAEEAMNFYTSIFKDAAIISVNRQGPGGKVISGVLKLEGQELYVLNGGPMFQFTEAISFFVNCDNQQEIDEFWEQLSVGGQKSRCGWLKDKFGLSWQIIPGSLGEMLNDDDPAKSQRVMQAMLQMDKMDIGILQQAYDQN
ncbi:MAG: VOC family protein [Gloeobacteraceae cyanobacterium ES-bin-316]|nr:VOC family protein [Ferruginibacter sp.]